MGIQTAGSPAGAVIVAIPLGIIAAEDLYGMLLSMSHPPGVPPPATTTTTDLITGGSRVTSPSTPVTSTVDQVGLVPIEPGSFSNLGEIGRGGEREGQQQLRHFGETHSMGKAPPERRSSLSRGSGGCRIGFVRMGNRRDCETE